MAIGAPLKTVQQLEVVIHPVFYIFCATNTRLTQNICDWLIKSSQLHIFYIFPEFSHGVAKYLGLSTQNFRNKETGS